MLPFLKEFFPKFPSASQSVSSLDPRTLGHSIYLGMGPSSYEARRGSSLLHSFLYKSLESQTRQGMLFVCSLSLWESQGFRFFDAVHLPIRLPSLLLLQSFPYFFHRCLWHLSNAWLYLHLSLMQKIDKVDRNLLLIDDMTAYIINPRNSTR